MESNSKTVLIGVYFLTVQVVNALDSARHVTSLNFKNLSRKADTFSKDEGDTSEGSDEDCDGDGDCSFTYWGTLAIVVGVLLLALVFLLGGLYIIRKRTGGAKWHWTRRNEMRAAALTISAQSARHAASLPPQVSSISAHVNSVSPSKRGLGEQGSLEVTMLSPDGFRDVQIAGTQIGFMNVPFTPVTMEPPPPYEFAARCAVALGDTDGVRNQEPFYAKAAGTV